MIIIILYMQEHFSHWKISHTLLDDTAEYKDFGGINDLALKMGTFSSLYPDISMESLAEVLHMNNGNLNEAINMLGQFEALIYAHLWNPIFVPVKLIAFYIYYLTELYDCCRMKGLILVIFLEVQRRETTSTLLHWKVVPVGQTTVSDSCEGCEWWYYTVSILLSNCVIPIHRV